MENQVQSSDIPEISYKAFISYRHLALDKEAAERIQKGIEHYIVPKEFRHLSGGKKLGKVFRDEDELPISSNLSDSITYALDHTEYLIVICTPDLPKSRWCAQEIRYFLETHDRNHIIAVLADGNPEESFSPYLLHEYDDEGNITADLEPLAANMAGEGHKLDPKSFSKEMMRIRAALLGVPFDSLWQRERRRRMVQIASGMAVIMAGLAVFLGVTLNKNAQIRRQNEQIREQNAQISEQNTQILSQNEEINEKNISMQKQLSSMLVDAGNGLLEEFDTRGAIANGLAAIENDDPAIYDHRAEQLLLNALGAFSTGEMTGELIHEQTTDIVDIAVPLHKDRVYLADLVGNISCLDINSGKLLWSESSVYASRFDGEVKTRLFLAEDQGLLLCKNYYNLSALSLEDGSLTWNYVYESANNMFALSDDGNRIAIFDRAVYLPEFDPSREITSEEDYNHITDLIFLSSTDGTETGRFAIGEDQSMQIPFTSSDFYGATFSDSGKSFACGFAYESVEDRKTGHYEYYLINSDTAEQLRHGTSAYSLAASDIFYGIAIDEATTSLFVAQYNAGYGGILVSHFHGGTLTVDNILVEQTLRGKGDLFVNYNDLDIQPMCFTDHLVVIASENSVFILDRNTTTLKKSFALSGNVLDMHWLDKKEECIEIITSAGEYAYYDLQHDDGWFDSYRKDDLKQNNNGKAAILLRPASGNTLSVEGFLTVPADHSGRLVRVRMQKDPHIRHDALTGNASLYQTAFCSSPSGERVFRLTYENKEWVLSAFQAKTGVLIAQNKFPDGDGFYNLTEIHAIDEEHVLGRYMIMPLEGEAAPIHALKDMVSRLPIKYDAVKSCRLYNGQIMTVVNLSRSSIMQIPFDYVGLNGATVLAINEPENRVMFQTRSVFEIGANGYELGYGIYQLLDESEKTLTASEEPAYVLFDAIGEKRYIIPDAAPAAEQHVSVGTVDPVFICGDDVGCVWLYDIPSGKARLVTNAYSRNEIMDVCMIPGDRQAAVFSRTGRLDILNLEDGQVLYSNTYPSLNTFITDYSCSCELDEQNERLYLFINYLGGHQGALTRVDMRSWTTDFSYNGSDCFGWSRADDRIYFASRDIYSFPAYKLEDLKLWAQEKAAEYAE